MSAAVVAEMFVLEWLAPSGRWIRLDTYPFKEWADEASVAVQADGSIARVLTYEEWKASTKDPA